MEDPPLRTNSGRPRVACRISSVPPVLHSGVLDSASDSGWAGELRRLGPHPGPGPTSLSAAVMSCHLFLCVLARLPLLEVGRSQ